jgi:23S rRNA (uridine2552-2'-O)-methyltransferase
MKVYRDHYFLKARRENYPARSIYKLRELDDKFRLFASGMHVLDLGAAPGSWSLGAAEKVGEEGMVVACDLQETTTIFPPQVRFFVTDVFEPSPEFAAAVEAIDAFDVVLSDMAPRTTGARVVDHVRSLELAARALALAGRCLGRGGSFVVKLFMGPDTRELEAPMRRSFARVRAFKPKSSRAESRELFFVGQGFMPTP